MSRCKCDTSACAVSYAVRSSPFSLPSRARKAGVIRLILSRQKFRCAGSAIWYASTRAWASCSPFRCSRACLTLCSTNWLLAPTTSTTVQRVQEHTTPVALRLRRGLLVASRCCSACRPPSLPMQIATRCRHLSRHLRVRQHRQLEQCQQHLRDRQVARKQAGVRGSRVVEVRRQSKRTRRQQPKMSPSTSSKDVMNCLRHLPARCGARALPLPRWGAS
mmetsp:Transcript_16059/g.26716  ORF Transcript_16059/g.26716 Transcript_16059/m.26716 type:complete len:219 (+) Transcript_16059:319-975(+)